MGMQRTMGSDKFPPVPTSPPLCPWQLSGDMKRSVLIAGENSSSVLHLGFKILKLMKGKDK